MKRISIVAIAITFSGAAYAGDADDKLAGVKCTEVKDLVKLMSKMQQMKPEQTDSVHANPKMTVTPKDGGGLPERVFFRHENEETPFTLTEDGKVTDIHKIGGVNKKGEMCVQDAERAGLAEGKDSLEFSMAFHVEYKNQTGYYTINELRDGLDDGRAHVKKIVPAPVKLILPKFTHVMITYLDDDGKPIPGEPQITAKQGDTGIEGLSVEEMSERYFVNVDQLDELGADKLNVKGGIYRMEPSAGPEKMRKMIEKRREAESEN